MVQCFGMGSDYSACNGVTVGTNAARFTNYNSKRFINDWVGIIASAFNVLLSGGLQYIQNGPNGTYQQADLVKAILAGRCVLTGAFTDSWKIVSAIFYTMKTFSLGQYFIQGINYLYPYTCACANMVNEWANAFGSGGASINAQLSNCSESSVTSA